MEIWLLLRSLVIAFEGGIACVGVNWTWIQKTSLYFYHDLTRSDWYQLVRVNFSKTNKIARARRASAIWGLWKVYKCLFNPNCTRKIMWLLINKYEKISRWLSRRNACVSRYQEKITPWIAPSRARVWFENKRFDWPSVSFFDQWPIRILGLFPLFALN